MPETEEALVGGARPSRSSDAVHPRRVVLHPDREAQLVRGRGRERQPVADLAPRPAQPPGDGDTAGGRRHRGDRRPVPVRRDLVADLERPLRDSVHPVAEARALGRRKLPSGSVSQSTRLRLAAVRHRQHPAAAAAG